MDNETLGALPAPPEQLLGDELRNWLWVKTALEGEFNVLASLPEGENIKKGNSVFFGSLLRIGAITKGAGQSYLSPQGILEDIQIVCSRYSWLPEKEIERQWGNAYKMANPRFRSK